MIEDIIESLKEYQAYLRNYNASEGQIEDLSDQIKYMELFKQQSENFKELINART